MGSVTENLDLPILASLKTNTVIETEFTCKLVTNIPRSNSRVINHFQEETLKPGYCRIQKICDKSDVSAQEWCQEAKLKELLTQNGHTKTESVVSKFKDRIKIHVPVVWPKNVQKYVLRHHWPSSRVTKQMLREECYLVPQHTSVGLEAGWRYSFCDSERVLCNHLGQKQRTCFRVLKALIQRNMSDENSLSYYLKVALFWTCCDEVKSGKSEDAGTFIFMLLKKYISFLESGILPCFFVPECNLIGHVPDERRERWLKKMKMLQKDILTQMGEFWEEYSLCRTPISCWHLVMSAIIETVKSKVEHLNTITEILLLFNYTIAEKYTEVIDLAQNISIFDFKGCNKNKSEILIQVLTLFIKRNPCDVLKGSYVKSLMYADYATILHQVSLSTKEQPTEVLELSELFYKLASTCDPKHETVDIKYAYFCLKRSLTLEMEEIPDTRAMQDYKEKAVSLLFDTLADAKHVSSDTFWINHHIYDTLDNFLKISLLNNDEKCYQVGEISYYFLLNVYQSAHVFAEVCVPTCKKQSVYQSYLSPQFWGALFVKLGRFKKALTLFMESSKEDKDFMMLYAISVFYCRVKNTGILDDLVRTLFYQKRMRRPTPKKHKL